MADGRKDLLRGGHYLEMALPVPVEGQFDDAEGERQ